MSDFVSDFDLTELAVSAVHLGWPGLLIGAAVGLWAWRDRRSFGGAIGAFLGMCVWAGASLTVL